MKHYIILLRESKIGYATYVDKQYIKSAPEPDEILPFPFTNPNPLNFHGAIAHLLQEGYVDCRESLATAKMRRETRESDGMIRTWESEQVFPISIIEFVLNGFGSLSAIFFNVNGEPAKNLHFELK